MLGMKELDALQLHGLLQEQDEKGIVLLDVRTPAEAARGGIVGARNVPLHLLPVVGHELDNEASLVLYCHTGARSAQGCAFLMTRGYSNVYNLRGGILGWAQSGRPLAPVESMAASA
jgi:rhodanese-related sulfurtransferase